MPRRKEPSLFDAPADPATVAGQAEALVELVGRELATPVIARASDRLAEQLSPGMAVLATTPRAGETQRAWVRRRVGQGELVSATGRRVLAIDLEPPTLPPELIELAEWMSRHERCRLGQALALILPPAWPPPASRGAAALGADPADAVEPDRTGPKLTDEQRSALDQLLPLATSGQGRLALLFGVTGSGKTEVFVRLAQAMEEAGAGSLILVPEIALAVQAITRLRGRFRSAEVWHSAMSPGEKARAWERLRTGQTRVAIGTRSAAFLPIQGLRLIVLDEEQEPTYKHLAAPRYHARQVAQRRGQQEGALCLLASATPSLEAWRQADAGAALRVSLTRRATGVAEPTIHVVDRSAQPLHERHHLFSQALMQALHATLAAGQQAVLLMNRRGWAAQLRCDLCGHACACERCSALVGVFSAPKAAPSAAPQAGVATRPMAPGPAGPGWLRCRHCGWSAQAPVGCPRCGAGLSQHRQGVEHASALLQQLLPKLAGRTMTLSSDLMRRLRDYEHALAGFARGEADVLIGTQMVAKGLDFPRVTLVGVLDADQALAIPDFRAAERTAQLLLQVAGRGGRAQSAGQVIVQTAHPDHPALQVLRHQDWAAFAREELALREALRWPPYARLAKAVLQDASPARLRREAAQWRVACLHAAHPSVPGLEILEPGEVSARRRELYVLELLWRADTRSALTQAIDLTERAGLRRPKVTRFHWDMDPVE